MEEHYNVDEIRQANLTIIKSQLRFYNDNEDFKSWLDYMKNLLPSVILRKENLDILERLPNEFEKFVNFYATNILRVATSLKINLIDPIYIKSLVITLLRAAISAKNESNLYQNRKAPSKFKPSIYNNLYGKRHKGQGKRNVRKRSKKNKIKRTKRNGSKRFA